MSRPADTDIPLFDAPAPQTGDRELQLLACLRAVEAHLDAHWSPEKKLQLIQDTCAWWRRDLFRQGIQA